MGSIFRSPRPAPPPPVIAPPPPPEPEVDPEVFGPEGRRKRVGRAALISTSPQGILTPANTGRRRLTAL